MMAPVDLRLATDEARFGGKSVQLGASLRNELPVPPGWALSVEYVEAIVGGDKAALATLEDFLRDKAQPFAVRSSGVGEDAKHRELRRPALHRAQPHRLLGHRARHPPRVELGALAGGARLSREARDQRGAANRRDAAEDGVSDCAA
jgi:hypothetical protein